MVQHGDIQVTMSTPSSTVSSRWHRRSRGLLSFLDGVLLALVEEVCLGAAEVHDLGTSCSIQRAIDIIDIDIDHHW